METILHSSEFHELFHDSKTKNREVTSTSSCQGFLLTNCTVAIITSFSMELFGDKEGILNSIGLNATHNTT